MAKGYSSIIVEVQDDGSINVTHDVEGTVIVEVLDYKWSEEHTEDVPFDVYTGERYVAATRKDWDEFIREVERNRESYYDEREVTYHGYDCTKDYYNDNPPEPPEDWCD